MAAAALTRSDHDSRKSKPIDPKSPLLVMCVFRFRPQMAERLIHSVLVEALGDKQYNQELCKTWTEQISTNIKNKLKGELNYPHCQLNK